MHGEDLNENMKGYATVGCSMGVVCLEEWGVNNARCLVGCGHVEGIAVGHWGNSYQV